MEIIHLEDATKIYNIGEVETRALNGVTATFHEGEFAALVGPSGSGKTTMLQLMGCLDLPNSGSIIINGKDVTRFSKNQRADLRREVIGFIFQFFALVPVLSAYENVELPLLLNGVQRQAAARTRHGDAGRGGPGRPRRPSAGPDERRAAAARGHRPCPGAEPADRAGRRADGQPGHGQRRAGHGHHAAVSTRRRARPSSSPRMTRA